MSELLKQWEQEQLRKPMWLSSTDIKPCKASFLTNGIPDDNITLLVGDGGVGKGFLSCHLVAAVTTGSKTIFDDEPVEREAGNVILLNAEDSYSRQISRRLTDAGADHSRIITFNELAPVPEIPQIIEAVSYYQPKLLVMDPLQSFVPDRAAMERRNVMRKVMEPLQKAAAQYKCAVLILMHTNKRIGAYGRNRVADSSDIWDIARSVFIMGDIHDPDYTKYISHEKSSYAMPLPTQLCRIDGKGLYKIGETEKKDRDYVIERDKHAGGRPTAKRDEAEDIITSALEKSGSMTGRELENVAAQNDISKAMLNRIRAELVKNGIIEKISSGSGKSYGTRYKLCDEF